MGSSSVNLSHCPYLRINNMDGPLPRSRALEVGQRRKPFKPGREGVLARREQRVRERVVMEVLALHGVLDGDKVLLRDLHAGRLPHDSQDLQAMVQRLVGQRKQAGQKGEADPSLQGAHGG